MYTFIQKLYFTNIYTFSRIRQCVSLLKKNQQNEYLFLVFLYFPFWNYEKNILNTVKIIELEIKI